MRRPKRLLAALALVVLAVVAGTAILGRPADPARDLPDAAPDAATAPTAARRPRVRARSDAPSAAVARSGTPAPEAAAAADPSVPRPARILRVVDATGAPVADVEVRSAAAPEAGSDRVDEPVLHATDDRGEVRFATAPVGGTVTLRDRAGERAIALDRDVTTVVVDLPDLEVVVADADTGARAFASGATLRVGGAPRDVGPGGGTLRNLPLGRSRDGGSDVSVQARAGRGPSVGGRFPVSRWARAARFVVPAFRETTVDLIAVDRDQRPLASARVARASIRQRSDAEVCGDTYDVPTHDPSGADGRVRVLLPQIPANCLSLAVTRPAEDFAAYLAGSCDVPLDARDRAGPIVVALVEVEPFAGRGGGHRNLRAGCGSARASQTAPLVVRVLRAGGAPAEGVSVRVRGRIVQTGGDGTARFENLVVGETTAVAFVHGFLPTAARVTIGATPELTIREAEPRTATVLVVDESGRPVPCARVLATSLDVPDPADGAVESNCRLAAMDGDVEDLAPRTDGAGRVAWRVPQGRVRYHVSLVGAATEVETTADEVRVVLPTAK